MLLEPDAIVQVLLRERSHNRSGCDQLLCATPTRPTTFSNRWCCRHLKRSRSSARWTTCSRKRCGRRGTGRWIWPEADICSHYRIRFWICSNRVINPADSTWSDRSEPLHHCLNELTPSARQLLQMKYAEGLTALVIAERLRRTTDAIYQSLSRIHHGLRVREASNGRSGRGGVCNWRSVGMNGSPDQRLDELFVRYWDNVLTRAEADELETLLANRSGGARVVSDARRAGGGCGGIAPGYGFRAHTRD